MNDNLNMRDFTVRVQRTPDYPEAWLFHVICHEGFLLGHTSLDLVQVLKAASDHLDVCGKEDHEPVWLQEPED